MKRRTFLRRAGALILAPPALGALGAAAANGGRAGNRAAGDVAAADLRLVEVTRHRLTMGSVGTVTLYGPDERMCEEAIGAAFAEMERTDVLMSSYRPESDIGRLNLAAGRGEVVVQAEVARALAAAGEFHALTGGAFDATVGPLLELYGFQGAAGTPAELPDDRTIAAVLGAVGHSHLVLDPRRSTAGLLNPRSRVDLGGIGVGHALDRAAAALRARGVERALLNHGGDILLIGAPPGADGWEIGIQDPDDPRGTAASYCLRDRSISTSGNYENSLEIGTERVGHLLDPVTGRTASRYLSVSVMAETSTAADALSTGFFTGGIPAGAGDGAAGTVSVFSIRDAGGRRECAFREDVSVRRLARSSE